MICPTCGAQIDDNATFCTQCGSPVQNNTTPEYAPMEDHPTELFEETPAYEAPAYETPAYEAPAYDATPVYNAEPYSYSGSEAPAQDPGAGLGKASKILGIFGIITSCCGFGMALAIVSIILGIIGSKKSSEAGFENASAKTGKILGIVGIVIAVIVWVAGFALGIVGGLAESSMYYY